MVAHPVMQVIGEQALVDILDLSEVTWTCWGVSTTRSGLGLRMVKELEHVMEGFISLSVPAIISPDLHYRA